MTIFELHTIFSEVYQKLHDSHVLSIEQLKLIHAILEDAELDYERFNRHTSERDLFLGWSADMRDQWGRVIPYSLR